jgi:hypothetical protein
VSDAPPSPPPNVAALVDAIDVRAKQAGADGATEVMQRLLGSVTDVLTSIADRLDAVEEGLHDRAADSGESVVEVVRSSLASFNARLGRLEEAFVQAVDSNGSGAQTVVDEVRAAVVGSVGERLDAFEGQVVAAVEARPPVSVTATADLSSLDLSGQLTPLVDRLDRLERQLAGVAGLEALLRTRSDDRPDTAAEVRAAVAPTTERLQALESAVRAAGDHVARVDAAVAAVPSRFTHLEETIVAAVAALADGEDEGVDDDVLTRLEEAVDRLDRDEASARLVRLVEERLSAGLRAVTERTDEVRRSLESFVASAASTADASSVGAEQVRARVDALTSEVRSLTTLPDSVSTALAARLGPLADRVGGLDARLDGLHARVAGIDEAVIQLHSLFDSIAAMPSRLDELVARPLPRDGADPELASAVAAVRGDVTVAIAALRDDLSGRLDALATASTEVTSGDDVTVAIAALSSSLENRLEPLASNEEVTEAIAELRRELERRLDALAAGAVAPPPPTPEAPTHTAAAAGDPETRAAILALTSSLADRFEALERRLGQTSPIEDLVRRETELLTQRVAALAVGVEATRALVEQQQTDAENRIGRKAGEVTRRLAADFGIRTGRPAPGGGRGRRDPRELGPPS